MKIKTLFISDIHLGSRISRVDLLLPMLADYQADTIYLVGDVFEFPAHDWTQRHKSVIRALMQAPSKIIYLPGNHDAVFRIFAGLKFGNLQITDSIVHTTVDGRRFLVIHGDQFDCTIKFGKLFSWLYRNNAKMRGWNHWLMKINRFPEHAKKLARRHGVDGIICGHTHLPTIDGMYINLGDWVEHCSAVIEHLDGRLELV
jgi:UDP-2,3-diacylglucosamine pyrophosphatase LpxH